MFVSNCVLHLKADDFVRAMSDWQDMRVYQKEDIPDYLRVKYVVDCSKAADFLG